ncbi:MAG: hypothetical protein J5986_07310 [Roseburia sp.]|nr:hypothetical protein [Roseburia sp.]
MNNNHRKKMVAPIIIAGVLIVYYAAIAAVCFLLPEIPVMVKVLFVVVPLALAGVAIAMLSERIREIRSGEEDDLSKY